MTIDVSQKILLSSSSGGTGGGLWVTPAGGIDTDRQGLICYGPMCPLIDSLGNLYVAGQKPSYTDPGAEAIYFLQKISAGGSSPWTVFVPSGISGGSAQTAWARVQAYPTLLRWGSDENTVHASFPTADGRTTPKLVSFPASTGPQGSPLSSFYFTSTNGTNVPIFYSWKILPNGNFVSAGLGSFAAIFSTFSAGSLNGTMRFYRNDYPGGFNPGAQSSIDVGCTSDSSSYVVGRGKLAKYNEAGAFQWAKNLSIGGYNTILIDEPNSCMYISGQTATRSGSTVSAPALCKFDLNGNLIWSRITASNYTTDGSYYTTGTQMVLTSTGNILMYYSIDGGLTYLTLFSPNGTQLDSLGFAGLYNTASNIRGPVYANVVNNRVSKLVSFIRCNPTATSVYTFLLPEDLQVAPGTYCGCTISSGAPSWVDAPQSTSVSTDPYPNQPGAPTAALSISNSVTTTIGAPCPDFPF